MSKKTGWAPFPYRDHGFEYAGPALKKNWARLHLGDQEPYPSAQSLAKLCKGNSALAESIPDFDGDYAALSEKLLEAWRRYHLGEFQQAVQLGLDLGVPGYAVANKATAIYANYLEPARAVKLKLFEEVSARAQSAIAVLPEHANSHYLYAYALGRRSQAISVLEALTQGIGGKVKDALDRTLELEPGHAEAHTAVATCHAEIVDKVGSVLGALTYGTSKDAAVRHYRKALELHPRSAIARIEFANGLMMMYGKDRLDEATNLYIEASNLEPCDAMERLDVELAKSRLEEVS
jgi:tetratricopeptide (TPR) repeat protein